MWKERNIVRVNEPIWTRAIESLPPGQNLKYETWKTLNRLRVGVARTKKNLVKWKKEDVTFVNADASRTKNTYWNAQ